MLNKKKILGEVKKALAITLACVMVTGFAQDLGGGVLTVSADSGKSFVKSASNTYLANAKFYNDYAEVLKPEDGNWEVVYFGGYSGKSSSKSYLFRVLDASSNTRNSKGILLDCSTHLSGYTDVFDYPNGSSNFASSKIKNELNTTYLNRDFSSVEKSAIKESALGMLFVLGKADLENSEYGYSGAAQRRKEYQKYWTSTNNGDSNVWYVDENGNFLSIALTERQICMVSPALYLDPAKILFWSNPNGTLSTSFNLWKLTLVNEGASVSVTNVAKCAKNNTIKLHYAITDSVNTYNNLSVLITEKERTNDNAIIKSLGTVLENTDGIQAAGDVNYNLPAWFDANTQHAYLVAQRQNANEKTDFATLTEIVIPKSTDSHIYGDAYWKTTTEPKCTTTGTEEEYKKCEICGEEVKTGSQPKSINALGHDYGAITYSFSADGKTCTAQRTCKRDGCGNKETETVNTTLAVKTPAAVGKKGVTTYIAKFANKVFSTQTTDIEDIPALVDKKDDGKKDDNGSSNTGDNGKNNNSGNSNSGNNNNSGDINSGNNAGNSNTKVPVAKGQTISTNTASFVVVSSDAKNPTVTLSKSKNTNATTITVPGSVKINGVRYTINQVSKNAFKNNKKAKKAIIHKNITKIGDYAFSGCSSLTTVTGGAGVKIIGKGAFNGCVKLKKAPIGAKVTSIGEKAFYNCNNMTTMVIPVNVNKLGKQFAGKTPKMKTVTVKTKKLTKKNVNAKAYTGMGSKNTVTTVPKGMGKTYKTLFQNKGMNKKIKIKQSKK